ncbi:MAG TPA: DUF177 domain-containing protein, partial [Candidatus Aminicenantes bacterium]|nr:DUF177 domain-containing protein [Candidatus Aminicenantes bacterium]
MGICIMIIDIDRLSPEGLEIERDFEFFNSELVEEEAVFLEPAHAEVTLRRTGDEILLKGRIKTKISLICCRCLSPFELPVDSHFDLVYLPEELEEEKEQLETEDLLKNFYYNRRVNLRKIILEQVNLTFPARPLCSEDCPGICPVCGKNIKEEGCSCDLK